MTCTHDYPYCWFGFDEWNEMQEKCLPYFTEDRNLVVSASMASGKTAVAEAVMGYELVNGKVIYTSPLHALNEEKHRKWRGHPTFCDCKAVLLDREHHPTDDEMEESEIVISTIESLDIACRAGKKWIEDAVLLVFDEAQLFDCERRGSAAEAMLMAFTERNPDARIVLLSGTLSNTREIAGWVKSLNGKQTVYVNSNWMPVKMEKDVAVIDGLHDQMAFVEKNCKKGQKTIVFVHSKKMGEILARELKRKGIGCGFFHSGLKPDQRSALLSAFRRGSSRLDVLVATSSLGMGVDI